MTRAVTMTEDDEVTIYNALCVAEQYARGEANKEVVRAAVRIAHRLGLPFKHPTDVPPKI